jgi:hypothetical protein
MKDRVDKSMGIVTRIAEALARIKPTEPLRLAKREARHIFLQKKSNLKLFFSWKRKQCMEIGSWVFEGPGAVWTIPLSPRQAVY